MKINGDVDLTRKAANFKEAIAMILFENKPQGPTGIIGMRLAVRLCEALAGGSEDGSFSEEDFTKAVAWAHGVIIEFAMIAEIAQGTLRMRMNGDEPEWSINKAGDSKDADQGA
jgi:hypothetical protein